ncbi:MAG: hypothetical protein JW801_18715 [Bacteroidales bacterium]|nr:hypothetical protein [Bacteroidales bacterium]
MKKTALILITLLLILSCAKEPFDYLIGAWDDVDTERTIFFDEEGRYGWSIPYPGVDPNCGIGSFSVNGDTLCIEEYTWGGDLVTSYFLFRADRKSLQLTNLETEEIKNYTR